MKNILVKKFILISSLVLIPISFLFALEVKAVVADEGMLPPGSYIKIAGFLPGDILSITNSANGTRIDAMVFGNFTDENAPAILLAPVVAERLGVTKNSNTVLTIKKNQEDIPSIMTSRAINSLEKKAEPEYELVQEVPQNEKVVALSETNAVLPPPTNVESETLPKAEIPQQEVASEPIVEKQSNIAIQPEVKDDMVAEDKEQIETQVLDAPTVTLVSDTISSNDEEESKPSVSLEATDTNIKEQDDFVFTPFAETQKPLTSKTYSDNLEPLPENITSNEVLKKLSQEDKTQSERTLSIPAVTEQVVKTKDKVEDEPIIAQQSEDEFTSPPTFILPNPIVVSEKEPDPIATPSEPVEPALETKEEFTAQTFVSPNPIAVSEKEPDPIVAPSEPVEPIEPVETVEAVESSTDNLVATEPEPVEVEQDKPLQLDEPEIVPNTLITAEENPPPSNVLPDFFINEKNVADTVEPRKSNEQDFVNSHEANDNVVFSDFISEFLVESFSHIGRGSYGIQIASYKDQHNIKSIIDTYAKKYPIKLIKSDKVGGAYQIVVAPLTKDEYGIVLERFKEWGFKDAFLRTVP